MRMDLKSLVMSRSAAVWSSSKAGDGLPDYRIDDRENLAESSYTPEEKERVVAWARKDSRWAATDGNCIKCNPPALEDWNPWYRGFPTCGQCEREMQARMDARIEEIGEVWRGIQDELFAAGVPGS